VGIRGRVWKEEFTTTSRVLGYTKEELRMKMEDDFIGEGTNVKVLQPRWTKPTKVALEQVRKFTCWISCNGIYEFMNIWKNQIHTYLFNFLFQLLPFQLCLDWFSMSKNIKCSINHNYLLYTIAIVFISINGWPIGWEINPQFLPILMANYVEYQYFDTIDY